MNWSNPSDNLDRGKEIPKSESPSFVKTISPSGSQVKKKQAWLSRKKLIVSITVIIVSVVLAAGFNVIKKQKTKVQAGPVNLLLQAGPETEKKPIMVKTAPVKMVDFEDLLPAMGNVRGYIEVDLKFGINGSIEKFNFKDGEKVEKNQLIAALQQDDAIVKQKYAQLKREEYEGLFKLGAIVESKLEQVKLEEQLAKIELEKTELRAPFNGVINNREAETGKFVTPNDRVATFSSIDEIVAEVGIIEKDLEKIKAGQRALVTVDSYPNAEFEGVVDNISSSFEGKSRTLTARVKVPNPKELLMPGMFARVIIYIYEQKNALVIPAVALEKKAGEYWVFVVTRDSKAEKRQVEIEYLTSEEAVLSSGLEESELVVADKMGELADGDEVNVLRD